MMMNDFFGSLGLNEVGEFFNDMKRPLLRTDIIEKESCAEILADVPGFEKNEISVKLENGVLTITAQKTEDTENETGRYIRKERFSKKAERRFTVGERIRKEDIKASLNNGVLRLIIEKKERPADEETSISIE